MDQLCLGLVFPFRLFSCLRKKKLSRKWLSCVGHFLRWNGCMPFHPFLTWQPALPAFTGGSFPCLFFLVRSMLYLYYLSSF